LGKATDLKIVLLPGLDGTGDLFKPFLLTYPDPDYEVIKLPITSNQDYNTLVLNVREHLPKIDFVLVGESFSGPIAAALASDKSLPMKGVIFVATFLSPPNPMLLNFAKWIPFQFMSNLPLAKHVLKNLLFERDTKNDLLLSFKRVLNDIPPEIIRQRLEAIRGLKQKNEFQKIPALCLVASHDKLVPKNNSQEFKKFFEEISVQEIRGSHFLLQTNPKDCGKAIFAFIDRLDE